MKGRTSVNGEVSNPSTVGSRKTPEGDRGPAMQVGFQAIPSSQRSSKQKLKEIDSRLLLHGHAEARIEHILIRQGSTETE